MPPEHPTIPKLDSALSLLRQLDRRGATVREATTSSQAVQATPTPETISSSRRGRPATTGAPPATPPAAQIFGRGRRRGRGEEAEASAAQAAPAAQPLAAITPRRVVAPVTPAAPVAEAPARAPVAPDVRLLSARQRFEAVNWSREVRAVSTPEPEAAPELPQLDLRLLTARQRFEAVNWSREARAVRPAPTPREAVASAPRSGGDPNSVDSFFSDINW